MLTIRLAKTDWAKAWRAMIEIATVRLFSDDPIYEVLPAHLERLKRNCFLLLPIPSAECCRHESTGSLEAVEGGRLVSCASAWRASTIQASDEARPRYRIGQAKPRYTAGYS